MTVNPLVFFIIARFFWIVNTFLRISAKRYVNEEKSGLLQWDCNGTKFKNEGVLIDFRAKMPCFAIFATLQFLSTAPKSGNYAK